MARTYAQKSREYNRRLLIISPIAAALIGLLFVTSDVVEVSEIEKAFGWEGETQILPQISIIPETDIFEDMKETTHLQKMAAMHLDPLDETGPEEGGERQEEYVEEPQEKTFPEITEDELRHFPVHTEVPYSEDYVILHMVQPEYPPRELLNGIEGDVTVEILVDEEGLVENAWILAALGPRTFEDASLAAVMQFRFKPPIRDGQPMPMWIRFQIRFRLFS